MARTGVKDGLGGNVVQAGSISALPVQSAIFIGSITATSIISGAQIFSAGSMLAVRLTGTDLIAAGSVVADGRRLAAAGIGSPTAWGRQFQAGSFTASDVNITTSFGTAFAGAPIVLLNAFASGAAAVNPGYVVGTSPGSFVAFGESGLLHAYIAIGAV